MEIRHMAFDLNMSKQIYLNHLCDDNQQPRLLPALLLTAINVLACHWINFHLKLGSTTYLQEAAITKALVQIIFSDF